MKEGKQYILYVNNADNSEEPEGHQNKDKIASFQEIIFGLGRILQSFQPRFSVSTVICSYVTASILLNVIREAFICNKDHSVTTKFIGK